MVFPRYSVGCLQGHCGGTLDAGPVAQFARRVEIIYDRGKEVSGGEISVVEGEGGHIPDSGRGGYLGDVSRWVGFPPFLEAGRDERPGTGSHGFAAADHRPAGNYLGTASTVEVSEAMGQSPLAAYGLHALMRGIPGAADTVPVGWPASFEI